MSICGKYDLYDHICMEKMYHQDPDNPNSPLVSDIMKCFDVFKERTGGVLYQHYKVEVNDFNKFQIEKKCPFLNIIEHKSLKEDKRYKNSKREIINYSYKYYDKEYSNLKELNKKGVYITREIKFDNIFEIIPYFSYIIASMSSNEDKEIIFISKENYIDKQYKQSIEIGSENADYFNHYYRKRLANITKEICLKYFSNYKERTIKEELEIIKENDRYIVHTPKDIDYNFEAKVDENNKDKIVCYSLTPKYVDKNTLDVSDTYFDIDKRDRIIVEYVCKGDKRCLK